jgi:hypothetical protein
MSACSGICPDGSNQVLLRWSDPPNSPFCEEFVQMLKTGISEAIVCSALKFREETAVSLVGSYYNESGTVRSCKPEGTKFIVTIRIKAHVPAPKYGIDPGVFAIDNFLTEEQELKILEELDQDLQ